MLPVADRHNKFKFILTCSGHAFLFLLVFHNFLCNILALDALVSSFTNVCESKTKKKRRQLEPSIKIR